MLLLPLVIGCGPTPCASTLGPSPNVVDTQCEGRRRTLRVHDIGRVTVTTTRGPLELEVSAWRLEGLEIRAEGRALCIDGLEPCDRPVGRAPLTKAAEVWTRTVHLDEAPPVLELSWVDAYR